MCPSAFRPLLCLTFSLAGLCGPGVTRVKVPHDIPRTVGEIKVDGRMDEAWWADALVLPLDYEVRPGDNVRPPVHTNLYLAYSSTALYVAFEAHDPEPHTIRARYSARDEIWNDDWVGIVLDTFNDERRAYELLANPLGTQADAVNDDMNGNYDTSWNAIWDSAGRITETGFLVEMSIPFNQLRFQEKDGAQVWGLDAVRSYPRRDKHHIGLFPRQRGANSYLAQEDKMLGFEGADPGSNLEIVPTVTSGRTDVAPCAGCDVTRGDTDGDMGVSVRWGMTPNITLSGTVNPDFSQVEADVVQLSLNEQFALFFPESRPFFLEGQDYFSTSLSLVHTRNIADPSAAAKVTGKSGRHTYGFFTARDEQTSVLVPYTESSSADVFAGESANTVGRYRMDYGNNSSVGALVTLRSGEDGYRNNVVSVDAKHRISETDQVVVNVASSQTTYNREMGEAFALGENRVDGQAGLISYRHSSPLWRANASYEDFRPGFRADMGFQPRVGYRKLVVGGNRLWYGKRGAWYNQLEAGSDWDQTETSDGDLIERELEAWFAYNGPKESYATLDVGHRTRVYEAVSYAQDFYNLRGGFTPSGAVHMWCNINGSDWIDFAHNREADRFSLQPGVRLNMGRHLKVDLQHNYSRLSVAGGDLFTAQVPELRVNLFFNRRTMVRTVVQSTDIRRDLSLVPEEEAADLAERSRDLLGQFLFSYKLNPQTVAYAGYTDSFEAENEESLWRSARTFFVKLGYAWLR